MVYYCIYSESKDVSLSRMGPIVQGVRGQLGLIGEQTRNRERFHEIRTFEERLGGKESARFRFRRVRGPQGRGGRRSRAGWNVSGKNKIEVTEAMTFCLKEKKKG